MGLCKSGTEDLPRPIGALGIHHTAQQLGGPESGPAGSVAYVVGSKAEAALYRFGDASKEMLSLDKARRVTNIR